MGLGALYHKHAPHLQVVRECVLMPIPRLLFSGAYFVQCSQVSWGWVLWEGMRPRLHPQGGKQANKHQIPDTEAEASEHKGRSLRADFLNKTKVA